MEKTGTEKQGGGWLEIRVCAPEPAAGAAADFLVGLTGLGVVVTDLADGSIEVTGYLERGPGLEEKAARLKEQSLAWGGDVKLEFSDLPAEDWGANWKKHFHPLEAAPGLWVAPPWEPMEPLPGQLALLVDPGQAFGTGQHQSTTLCLKYLVERARKAGPPRAVLDVGCGTGILSLAALALGARRAVALDTDPEAVKATLHNAGLNSLASGLEASGAPLAEVKESFDLVLANLTAGVIEGLAPGLAAALAPGGSLVLSGILLDQFTGVRGVMEGLGLGFKSWDAEGEWACMVLEWA